MWKIVFFNSFIYLLQLLLLLYITFSLFHIVPYGVASRVWCLVEIWNNVRICQTVGRRSVLLVVVHMMMLMVVYFGMMSDSVRWLSRIKYSISFLQTKLVIATKSVSASSFIFLRYFCSDSFLFRSIFLSDWLLDIGFSLKFYSQVNRYNLNIKLKISNVKKYSPRARSERAEY